MAFPSVRSQATTAITIAATSHSVSLPATVGAGDTLFVFVRCPAAGAIGWPDSSWNELFDGSPDGSVGQVASAWKKADGTEGGTTITVTTASGKLAGVSYAVKDATDPTLRAPELSTVATGTTPTQPNATTCTPTGGAKDYYWLTFIGMEGEATGITSYPTNYTLDQSGFINTGTGGAVTTNAIVVAAGRQVNGASEDTGAWTLAGTLDDWSAYTIAFHPAEVVPALLVSDDTETSISKPLARKSLATLSTFVVGTALTLLQIAATPAPFSQNIWPVPERSKPTLLVSGSTRPSTDPPKPFNQNEWPIARGKAPQAQLTTHVDQTRRHLIGLDTFFGAPGQAQSLDFPLPVRAGIRNVASTQNAIVDTTQPFNQTDWPKPLARPSQLLVAISTEAPPTSVTATPFGQNEWFIPRRQAVSTGLLSHLEVRKQYYVDPAPASPFTQFDWQNPRSIAFSNRLLSHLEVRQQYYTDAVTASFGQTEWPVPQRPRGTLLITTATVSPDTTPAAPVVFPDARQTDWSVPAAKSALRSLTNHFEVRKQFYVDAAVGTPFNQTVWPNPALKSAGVITNRWFAFYYVVDDTVPFNGNTDPLPAARAYPVILRTWSQSLVESTLFVAPPALPTARVLDWPNPAQIKVSQDLRTWTQNLVESTLFVTPAVFPAARQTEWPVPAAKHRLVDLRIHTEVRKQYYVDAIPAVPFAQKNWQNPQPRKTDNLHNRWFAFYYVLDDNSPFTSVTATLPILRKGMPQIWQPPNLLTVTLSSFVGNSHYYYQQMFRMMAGDHNMFLKQSTAAQARMVGPFISDTDFKTVQTGLTVANTDVKLSKNGAAGVNKNAGGGTHRNNGMYALTFDATDTDTVGEVTGSIAVSGALQVPFKFYVVEEAIYDALYAASAAAFDASQRVTVGTNADKTGYTVAVGGIAATAFAAGAIDSAAIATDAIGSAELAQSAAQEIADEVLNRDIAGGASGGLRNVRSALRRLRNRVAIAAGVATVYQENDVTAAWTAAVTTTAGNPVSEVDPT